MIVQLQEHTTEESARHWLETQAANWRQIAEARERDIAGLKQWCDQLLEAKSWLERKLVDLERDNATRAADYEEARGWLKDQIENWKAEAAKRDAAITELKSWTAQLEAGKAWLQNELDAAAARSKIAAERAESAEQRAIEAGSELGRRVMDLNARINSLRTAQLEAEETARSLREQLARARSDIESQRERIRSLHTPGGWIRTLGRMILRRPVE